MKKSTSKSPKLTTPSAAKPVPSVAKATAAAVKPVRVVKAKAPVAQKPVAAKSVAPVVVAPVAEVPSIPAKTVIKAQIDIGFGNTLFVRGEGAGLSWDKGVALDNLTSDLWSIVLTGAEKPVVFKFLINDLTWSVGEDYTVAVGSEVTLTPTF